MLTEVSDLMTRLKSSSPADYQLVNRYVDFLNAKWEQTRKKRLDYLLSASAITLWVVIILAAFASFSLALGVLNGDQVVRIVEILFGAGGAGAGVGAGY